MSGLCAQPQRLSIDVFLSVGDLVHSIMWPDNGWSPSDDDTATLLFTCWVNVCDVGPTCKQQCVIRIGVWGTPVAGGADFCKNLYTTQLALICMLHRKILKSEASLITHAGAYFGRNMVVFFVIPYGGGGG